jgi:hypothetical protein
MPAHRRKKESRWNLTHTLCVLIILFQSAIIVLLVTGWHFKESCEESPQLNRTVLAAVATAIPNAAQVRLVDRNPALVPECVDSSVGG